MKHIRSITHLLVVIAMTTLMQMAQAAAITPDGRQELVALYVTMFGRAPTAVQLAQLVASRENGQTLAQVAMTLSAETDFAFVASKDAVSFATYLTDALLSADAPATARSWATNWTITQLRGKMTKAQVIAEAVQAIRATPDTYYTSSKVALAATVSAVLTSIDSPTLIDEKKKAATVGILKDLLEIAEDLKIEQEDDTGYFKDGLKAAGGSNLKLPSSIYDELKTLESSLSSAKTEAERQAVEKKLADIQTSLGPWLGVAKYYDGSTQQSSRAMNDAAIENLRAINDRVLSNLTGSGGGSCRSVYNSTTHTYQQVCN